VYNVAVEETITTLKSWLGSGSINLFGRPFAGKDTQGRILADLFGGTMLSGGDILRHAKDDPEVQQIMASGGIIPSSLFEQIVLPHFSDTSLAGKPLLLSEVGRMLGEEQVILKVTANTGHPTKAVIELVLEETEVWRRFEAAVAIGDRGQRADDNAAVLQNRLDKYRDKVVPVLEIYRHLGLLIEIDGTLPRKEVTAAILESLLARSKHSVA
jgi:adenylate kinase